eukprot:4828605-Pleurochrysis_carterae.AAC.1
MDCAYGVMYLSLTCWTKVATDKAMRLHDNGRAVQLSKKDAKHVANIVEMKSKDDDVKRSRHLCVVLRLRLEPDAVVDILGEVLDAHESAAGK